MPTANYLPVDSETTVLCDVVETFPDGQAVLRGVTDGNLSLTVVCPLTATPPPPPPPEEGDPGDPPPEEEQTPGTAWLVEEE